MEVQRVLFVAKCCCRVHPGNGRVRQQASEDAVDARTAATIARRIGSMAWTPNSRLRTSHPQPAEPNRPTASPMKAGRKPSTGLGWRFQKSELAPPPPESPPPQRASG